MQELKPFFLIGTQRGGTTLLRLMLNQHGNLAVPPESHFLIPVLKALKGKRHLDKGDQQRVFDLITNHERFSTWRTNPKSLQQQFHLFPDNIELGNLIDTVFSMEVDLLETQRWGDKTPEYVEIFDELADVFPFAQFVFLIRDGRDVVESLANRGWQGWSVYQRARYWADATLKMQAFLDKYPKKSLLVKYEDLVLTPEVELDRICQFLGIPYDPAMMEYYQDADRNITHTEKSNRIHTKLNRLPQPADLQKWKRTANPSKVFFMESTMYSALLAMGYTLVRFSPQNPVHFLKKVRYTLFARLLNTIHYAYHAGLGEKGKEQLRNSGLGHFLRKMVRRA